MHIYRISKYYRVGASSLQRFGPREGSDAGSIAAFTKHGIERIVPIEALVKCKMQDNLEFLQWTKRYWDQYYPGGDYDALARRKGSGAPVSTGPPARTAAASSGPAAARRGTTPATTATARSAGARPVGGAASTAVVTENNQLKQTVEGLERERDFYFAKLRDIEILIQQAIDQDPDIEKDDQGLVKLIQQILYSTEASISDFARSTCNQLTLLS